MPIFFFFLFLLFVCEKNLFAQQACDNAFDRSFNQGPIEEDTAQYKLKCVERIKNKKNLPYFCATNGMPKEEAREKFGKTSLATIYSDNPKNDDNISNPIIGFWYVHTGKAKEDKNQVEEILLTTNNVGTRITKKRSNIGATTSQFLEKINISSIEKTIRYEKSVKSRSGWKLKEERVFDCETVLPYVEPPPAKPKSITDVPGSKGGMVPGTIDSKPSQYNPKASTISGTK